MAVMEPPLQGRQGHLHTLRGTAEMLSIPKGKTRNFVLKGQGTKAPLTVEYLSFLQHPCNNSNVGSHETVFVPLTANSHTTQRA